MTDQRAGEIDCICTVPEGTPRLEHDVICRQWNGIRLLSFMSNNTEESPTDGD